MWSMPGTCYDGLVATDTPRESAFVGVNVSVSCAQIPQLCS